MPIASGRQSDSADEVPSPENRETAEFFEDFTKCPPIAPDQPVFSSGLTEDVRNIVAKLAA